MAKRNRNIVPTIHKWMYLRLLPTHIMPIPMRTMPIDSSILSICGFSIITLANQCKRMKHIIRPPIMKSDPLARSDLTKVERDVMIMNSAIMRPIPVAAASDIGWSSKYELRLTKKTEVNRDQYTPYSHPE